METDFKAQSTVTSLLLQFTVVKIDGMMKGECEAFCSPHGQTVPKGVGHYVLKRDTVIKRLTPKRLKVWNPCPVLEIFLVARIDLRAFLM